VFFDVVFSCQVNGHAGPGAGSKAAEHSTEKPPAAVVKLEVTVLEMEVTVLEVQITVLEVSDVG